MKAVLLAIVSLCTLVACSQAAALAPVGGGRIAEVRFAGLDVLAAQQVDVLVAPVCSASGTDDADITCLGETADRKTIAVTSTENDQTHFEVLIGGTSIFRGVVQDQLDSAARPSP